MQIIKPQFLSDDLRTLKTPIVVSTLIVLPFIVMELVNRRDLGGGIPIPLFATMWLLAWAFMVILNPVLRRLPSDRGSPMSRASVLLRLSALMLIASVWIALVLDQMPCFLGVPNCD